MSLYPPKKSFEEVELNTNPNLPPWLITPKEEKIIFERWRKKAFAKCDDLIKAYVECSNSYSNPVEGMKKCDSINKESLGCVAKYQKMEYLDIERDIYIKEKAEKQKLYKELLNRKQKEQELKN
ncbi:hypothetical protein HYPBUDRAFT_3330 [Hyphopichia burtonii NRRL Y-1933]|uniref:COX assembly mitochondrial protein n=1 Tax=Hyphopichia burtonii NRRL Y-1933 TaxID=984485 RepID=A0A1E4RQK0_9ASCO|nr:hypothetical protein HYPBUDRAFT_3330 [Hyphopichia burtonii NRRL Y-1933]ODV69345.1 hypothetical protein HYPBUDRAFT_3330 [Hyphopichia burtonii NRRL Y-1933]